MNLDEFLKEEYSKSELKKFNLKKSSKPIILTEEKKQHNSSPSSEPSSPLKNFMDEMRTGGKRE